MGIYALLFTDAHTYTTFIAPETSYIYTSKYIKNKHYNKLDIIYKVLSTDKYIKINYNIPSYIEEYSNKIYTDIYNYHNMIIYIMEILKDDENNIIMKNIKKKQLYYAKKYKKLLLPY